MKLGKIFRHHQDQVWKTLSDGIGGELVDEDGWRSDKVVCEVEGHVVTLDRYSEIGYKSELVHTRFHTLVDNPDAFEFTLHHEGVADRVAIWFGGLDVHVGDDAFDAAFRITGSDEARVRKIFSSPDIIRRMMAEPDVHVHLGHAPSQEKRTDDHELVVMVAGEVKEVARLEEIFRLFADILHETAHSA